MNKEDIEKIKQKIERLYRRAWGHASFGNSILFCNKAENDKYE